MPFFQPQASFPLDFASSFSVMTHNSPEMFQVKHNMLWTKKLIKSDNVKVYSKFASLFSVMKDNSSVLFQFKPYIFQTKRSHGCQIFKLLSKWVRIHQIPHVIFETTSQLSFRICATFQCHKRHVLSAFSAETLYGLDKRRPSIYTISDF